MQYHVFKQLHYSFSRLESFTNPAHLNQQIKSFNNVLADVNSQEYELNLQLPQALCFSISPPSYKIDSSDPQVVFSRMFWVRKKKTFTFFFS